MFSLSSQNYRSFLIINVVYVHVIILSLKLNYLNLFGFRLLSRSSSRSYESLTTETRSKTTRRILNVILSQIFYNFDQNVPKSVVDLA